MVICIPRLAFLALLFAFPLHATAQTQPVKPNPCIAIAATSDIHGTVESRTYRNAQQDTIQAGGLMVYAGYVANLRQRFGEHLVVVDAGDMYQGTLISNLSQGQVVQELLELVQVQATTIGNHEFDYGALPGQADTLGVLRQRIGRSRFPFVNVNILHQGTQQRLDWLNLQPSAIRQVGPWKVGFLGATTLETPYSTNPQNITELGFAAPAPLVLKEAQRLRQQGADLVILLAHMGGECRQLHDPHDISSCLLHQPDGGELIQLIQALPKGTVDVVIGGHTHRKMGHFVQHIPTLQSGHNLQAFSWLEVCPRKGVPLEPKDVQLHANEPICLQEWADGTCAAQGPSPVRQRMFLEHPVTIPEQAKAIVQPFLQQAAAKAKQPLPFQLPQALDRRELSDLTAASFRHAQGTDFAMYNIGAVRSGLESGQPLFGRLYQSLPFDDDIAHIRLQGSQIIALLNLLGSHVANNAKAPSFAGLRITYNPAGQATGFFTQGNQPIEAERLYTLATTRFFINGGDGAGPILSNLSPTLIQETGTMVRDTLISYLHQHYPLPSQPPTDLLKPAAHQETGARQPTPPECF